MDTNSEEDEEDNNEDEDNENNIEGQIVQPEVGMKKKDTKELEYGYDRDETIRMKNSARFSVGVYDSLSMGRSE